MIPPLLTGWHQEGEGGGGLYCTHLPSPLTCTPDCTPANHCTTNIYSDINAQHNIIYNSNELSLEHTDYTGGHVCTLYTLTTLLHSYILFLHTVVLIHFILWMISIHRPIFKSSFKLWPSSLELKEDFDFPPLLGDKLLWECFMNKLSGITIFNKASLQINSSFNFFQQLNGFIKNFRDYFFYI